jgi:hypothetical protein
MDRRCGSCRYLSGYLVKHNRDKFVGQLEVSGLEDMVRAIENDDCIAGDVGLRM